MLLNIIIKEHGEFGVAFKLYFLHSPTIIGSTCVRVWIQEWWIEDYVLTNVLLLTLSGKNIKKGPDKICRLSMLVEQCLEIWCETEYKPKKNLSVL